MTEFPEGETTLAFSPVNEEQGLMPGSILVYVDVADIDATIARAKESGAAIYMDKMEIPDTGWMAIFGHPGGNRIAAMQRMLQRARAGVEMIRRPILLELAETCQCWNN